jgi:phage baseplate assembly protein W
MANLVNSIQTIPNRIDTAELARIKNQFRLRDRSNSDLSEAIKRDRSNPVRIIDRLATPASLESTTLRGLSYPLELDGNGGLKVAYGIDRIAQAIREVFETRIGERVADPFMGTRELLFETLSEDVEAQSIKRQLLSAIPYLRPENLSVSMSIDESGTCYIVCRYAVEGVSEVLVRYNFRA